MYSHSVPLSLPRTILRFSPSTRSSQAWRIPHSLSLDRTELNSAGNTGRSVATFPSGLQTPPGDCDNGAMGTTYQPPLAGYDDRHGPAYPASYSSKLLSDADRKRTILSDLTNSAAIGNGRSNSSNSFRTDSTYTIDHEQYAGAVSTMPQPLQPQGYGQPQTLFTQQRLLQKQADSAVLPGPSLALPPVTSASARDSSQTALAAHAFSGYPARPLTPTSSKSAIPSHPAGRSPITISDQDSACMVMHSLEVPKCISPAGGNLAAFTAELTCLFWFESPVVYQLADNMEMIPQEVWIPRICANAIPNPSFKAWVSRILTTTQVTQNVVFLALLFIYRLKSLNPMVRGKPGSEFRLLTVALMLGNKFLDDNTYTNKTWSDVSTLNVKDIHVMEVEFLSNMRYSLLVSATEWKEWLVKLAKFRIYYERASTTSAVSPHSAASPQRPIASPAASPTGAQQSVHSFGTGSGVPPMYDSSSCSPTARPFYASSNTEMAPQQSWPVPYASTQAVSPLAMKSDMNAFGKRSHAHDDPTEPPPKRLVRPGLPPTVTSLGSVMPMSSQATDPFSTMASTGSSGPVAETMRLPVPHLTLNTNTAQTQIPGPGSAIGSYQPAQSNLSLPPLAHGMRAMATVYPSNSGAISTSVGAGVGALPAPSTVNGVAGGASFPAKLSMMTTAGSSVAVPPATTLGVTGGSTPTAYAAPSFGTPTKRMSPLNALTPSVASVYAAAPTSSPLTDSFPHMASAHTPISHSPSIYLQQRASPYRPIRNVHMLLNPPPSSSLQEYQANGALLIPPTQMYYQPLGRRNDLRSGIVPEFQGLSYGGSAMRQGLALTPAQALQQQAMQHLQPMHSMHSMQPMQSMQPIQPMQSMSMQPMQSMQPLQMHFREVRGQPVQHLQAQAQGYAPQQPHPTQYGHNSYSN
ncbi:cyclin-related 2 [Grosmannia clavigera kw1407]|uniref:Cyclin-related 2 n=1 Tax=Grosmannia clavigera (strain kw1407 / UAMH 11150) TaxID=655863 RepID=F0XR71_GROCL|nr:cyclin-related 2 [Grosmannia clavigera kw1407]EFW99789.1 cyclin-related 2 [Grosmannia clavigera kw1407]